MLPFGSFFFYLKNPIFVVVGVGSRLSIFVVCSKEEKLHLQEEEKLRKDKEVSLPEARTSSSGGSMLCI